MLRPRIFLIICAFTYSVILSEINGAAFEIGARRCKSCSQRKSELSNEELKQLRVDYIKQRFLRKLQMLEPPKTNLPKPYIKPFLAVTEMIENVTQEEEERHIKTESVVIYPEEGKLSCIGTETYPCNRFDFRLTKNSILSNFLSGEVWLSTNVSSKPILVQHAITDSSENLKTNFEIGNIKILKLGSDQEMAKVSLPNSSFWASLTRDHTLTLQISYTTDVNSTEGAVDESEDDKPFLIINRESGGKSRNRRSPSCSEDNSSCCRENFHLNFAEIGWDNWILHPEGYQANFCRGRCFNDLSSTRFYHSAVLLSYIRDNKDIAEEIGLNMCCTPSVMSPVSIIYRNEEGLIFHKSIENMKVEACDCA